MDSLAFVISPATIIFIGAVVVAGGALWSSGWRPSFSRQNKGGAIIVFFGAVIVACGTLWSSHRQAGISQQLVQLQKSIIEYNIGADTVSILPVGKSADSGGNYELEIWNMHHIPIYDAYVNIRSNIDTGEHPFDVLRENIGNIGPYQTWRLKARFAPGHYQIDLRCRGGKTTHMLHFAASPGNNPDFSIIP